ncbi:hypothetical protein [Ureibacillus aquaedulcis]|uniref:Uncharacterized protein n=1 Tax=Ureibacillus aquaedulcis TaxID=3058421 RepID=A0ABT8GSK5_9BACL|nr:hypothetical protein [Ureibacillus sp. BA0131]MDN4494380.1 hypothetical protein [Ureibacillus sp. BA0131]
MKQAIVPGAYFLIASIITYFVELFLSLLIGGILFTAADTPPGDISDSSKLFYSVGLPVVYGFIFFGLYYLINRIVESFSIRTLCTGVLFHIAIVIYLIWNIVPDAF